MEKEARMPLAIYVLGFGIFAMTTSEFMVSGLSPLLVSEFGVSVAEVGYLISAYAAAMTIGGPLLTVALLKVPPKKALLMLFAAFLAGQILGAMAESYAVMVVARLITGAASSAVFGVSLAICVGIVGESMRGRASSVVLGGLMVGTVLGLPMATLIGQSFGWRASFWAVAGMVLLVGAVMLRAVPATPGDDSMKVRSELSAFRNAKLWAAFATSMLIIGATFAAFSYFAPILTDVSGFDPGAVPILLAVYGAATVIGNIVVGRLADKYTMSVLTVGLTLLAGFLIIFAMFADIPVVTVVALIGVGLVGVTMNPAMVTRVMRAANDRPLVNTVHTAVITLGVLLGSWLGGLTISAGYGLASPLWVGAALAVFGLLSLAPPLIGHINERCRGCESCASPPR